MNSDTWMGAIMNLKTLRPVLLLVFAAGCDGFLDVTPINEIAEEQAIISTATARAAVAGMYDALQDGSYYGGEVVFFGDLSGDDVEHTGTFTSYRQIDLNDITADNASVEGMWDALYRVIGRANTVITRVPGLPGLDPVERDQMLGEAYLVRALTYHHLVKFWGDSNPTGMGVPLRLIPPPSIPAAATITRATTGEVYTQIVSDLTQAEALMSVTTATTTGSLGATLALRARVLLYQQNWAGAEAAAEAVVAIGYALAPDYNDLFDADGIDTPEDIFRVTFTATEFCLEGYYYRHNDAGGRREITPNQNFALVYDPGYTGAPTSYAPTDLRGQRNISFTDPLDGLTIYGSKWPTGVGAEDIHVIRFAEVLLIQAEAEARQNKLVEAEASLTPVRTRAGLAAAGVDGMTQANAILTILQERRLELAYEGDRWPDLVRTGRAVTVMGIPAFQKLYPIPLNELDVAPGLVQNPGY